MAKSSDLLAESFELGWNEDQPEMFVGRSDLKLLQHFGQERYKILRDMQIVYNNQILLSRFFLQSYFC